MYDHPDDLRSQGYVPQQQENMYSQQPQAYGQPYPQYQQQYQGYQPQPVPPQAQRRPRSQQQGFAPQTLQRNKLLLISGIIAAIWFIVVCSSFASLMNAPSAGDEWDQMAYEIGTGIGLAMQVPFLIAAFIAAVFNWLAWFTSKKGFALTAGILFGVAFLLGIGNGFGFIPCIILSFMGYAKLKKDGWA
ncbi:MAG: hypothetical protein IJ461_09905 [Clostridia bacterium]|nr:hypothetical protein [Clostridia bacterium]